MVRLAVNRPFRLVLISLLTFYLVYAPVYSLSPARAEMPATPKKPLAPQPITKAHRPGEMIVKSRDDTPRQVRDQIIQVEVDAKLGWNRRLISLFDWPRCCMFISIKPRTFHLGCYREVWPIQHTTVTIDRSGIS